MQSTWRTIIVLSNMTVVCEHEDSSTSHLFIISWVFRNCHTVYVRKCAWFKHWWAARLGFRWRSNDINTERKKKQFPTVAEFQFVCCLLAVVGKGYTSHVVKTMNYYAWIFSSSAVFDHAVIEVTLFSKNNLRMAFVSDLQFFKC